MLLQESTTKKKLKQYKQTQDTYTTQDMSLLYTPELDAVTQQHYVLLEDGWVAPSLRPPKFPLKILPRDKQHLSNKNL